MSQPTNRRLAALIQGRHPAIRSVSILAGKPREAVVLARVQAPDDRHAEIRDTLTAAATSFQPRGKTLKFQFLSPIG